MSKISISDKISIGSAIIGFLGFILVIWQISITNSEIEKTALNQRAQLLYELQKRAFDSDDYKEVVRVIEFKTDQEIEEYFRDDKFIAKLTSLLSFLDFIAQLEKLELIKLSDVNDIFGYYIVHFYRNKHIEKYRSNLKGWNRKENLKFNVSFINFENLAKEIERLNNI